MDLKGEKVVHVVHFTVDYLAGSKCGYINMALCPTSFHWCWCMR